jgi:hypothetical protein
MAAYPSIPFRHRATPTATREVDESDAGDIRQVDLGADTVYEINVEHPIITQADFATLTSFYESNRAATNTITLDGVSYTVVFKTAYRRERRNATYINASVTLVGKAA